MVLSEVLADLKNKYPDLTIKGFDRVVIISKEPLSQQKMNQILRHTDRHAVVFFTTAEYDEVLKRNSPDFVPENSPSAYVPEQVPIQKVVKQSFGQWTASLKMAIQTHSVVGVDISLPYWEEQYKNNIKAGDALRNWQKEQNGNHTESQS